MAPSDQLAALIFSLEAADSPFERMHQLALAWRSIRELSRQERLELARHAGFDGAEELVERLAARSGGLAPAVLLEAIESARKADPSKLKAVFAGLRDRSTRGQVLADTLRAVGRAAAGQVGLGETEQEEAGASEQTEPTRTRTDADAEPSLPPVPRPIPDAEPEPGPSHQVPVSQADEVLVAVAPEAEEASVLPGDQPSPPPDEGPELERIESVEPEPDVEVGPRGGGLAAVEIDAAPRDATPEARFVPEPVTSAIGAEEIVYASGGDRLLPRLMRLRREATTSWAGADLERLLAGFPDGWPRRRALSALIEGRVVDSAAHALDLVVGLAAERDRAWCLGLLLRTLDLTDPEMERALGLVSSPSRRRRLRRLAG